METQLVVLGAGPGGYAAAFLAADLGMQVTLIEAEPPMNGRASSGSAFTRWRSITNGPFST